MGTVTAPEPTLGGNRGGNEVGTNRVPPRPLVSSHVIVKNADLQAITDEDRGGVLIEPPFLSRGSQVRILPGASAEVSEIVKIPANEADQLSGGGQALGEKRRHSAPLTNFEVASWSHFAADRRPAKGFPNSRVAQTRAVCEAPSASPRTSTFACQPDSVSGSRAWLRARRLA
jgi:hypothetical protein